MHTRVHLVFDIEGTHMRVTARLAVAGAVAAAGLTLALPTAAFADTGSAGNNGIGNGSQVHAPVQAPVNVCGNGVGVLGVGAGASGDCKASAAAEPSESPSACPTASSGGYESQTRESAPETACASESTPPSSQSPSASPSTVEAVTNTKNTGATLPVTGASLTILVVAALALLGAGAAALILSRRRRAA
ncbi:hypothetical protein Athai_03750 [Actinocatenispora thailandica]|uniref:Gram-positive cocci surface proteins LPxTG domain-containing protein n=2 Tax=Actinocatenispora thailandica TaxID=227318 RepID=A0A7R7HUF8_9ACTN|nr:hypothetical protein Athai_03750 [Actinocatenispora thailandica]